MIKYCFLLLYGLFLSLITVANDSLVNESNELWLHVLKTPDNIKANLNYAELAKNQKQYFKAMLAYERVLFVDPEHAYAKSQIRNMENLVKNPELKIFITSGLKHSSNGYLSSSDIKSNLEYFSAVSFVGKFNLLKKRWDTSSLVFKNTNSAIEDSNIDFLKHEMGPEVLYGESLVFIPKFVTSSTFINHKKSDDSLGFKMEIISPLFILNNSTLKVIFEDNDDSLNTKYSEFATNWKIGKDGSIASDIALNLTASRNTPDSGFDSDGTRNDYKKFEINIEKAFTINEYSSLKPFLSMSKKLFSNYQENSGQKRKDRLYSLGISVSLLLEKYKNSILSFDSTVDRSLSTHTDGQHKNLSIRSSLIIPF